MLKKKKGKNFSANEALVLQKGDKKKKKGIHQHVPGRAERARGKEKGSKFVYVAVKLSMMECKKSETVTSERVGKGGGG